jgi:hypothetical protein
VIKRSATVLCILATAIFLAGCVTPGQLRGAMADEVHLVGIVVNGPGELASPSRRGLLDTELAVDGVAVDPWVVYRVPGDDEEYRIDLAVLKPGLRSSFEDSLREELGPRLAPVEETLALPGIEGVTDRDSFESFVAARRSGTFLFVTVEIEPDLNFPRVTEEFELEDDRRVAFKASENVPRIVQIDVSARLDLRTPERPARNLLRYRFNRNYARAGTPNYPSEILARPQAFLASDPPGPIVIAVDGGRYRVTVEQEEVAEDLLVAAARLGAAAAQPFSGDDTASPN